MALFCSVVRVFLDFSCCGGNLGGSTGGALAAGVIDSGGAE